MSITFRSTTAFWGAVHWFLVNWIICCGTLVEKDGEKKDGGNIQEEWIFAFWLPLAGTMENWSPFPFAVAAKRLECFLSFQWLPPTAIR